MAEYNPSKIIKDGNTYNFRDDTKIPLAGSNQISGDLIPSTDNSIDIGSSTKNIKMLYTKGIAIDGKTIDTDASYNMTYDGNIVDTIEEQGNKYIRYTNGIQICWGLGEYDNGQIISYVKAFINEPSVVTSSTANADDWSATSFKMTVFDGRNYVCWQAIGKWK